MYYALLIEPEYGDTYWGHQFSKEIQIQSRKLGYHKVPFDRHTPSLILGSDPQWLVKAMSQAGNAPHVLLNCNPQALPKLASTVSFDYAGSLRTAQEFLQANALSRPALFVVNRNSTNDCYMADVFAQQFGGSGIYYFGGEIACDCHRFLQQRQDYDCLICTNFIYADIILRYLEEHGIQLPTLLFGLVDSQRYPYAHSFFMDFHALTAQAFRILGALVREPAVSNVQATIRCPLLTDQVRPKPQLETVPERTTPAAFYADTIIRQTLLWKEQLQESDEIDQEILRSLCAGMRYMQISQQLFLSESAVKYRVAQMVTRFRVANRAQLIALARRYGVS